jgi:hypothetical protein
MSIALFVRFLGLQRFVLRQIIVWLGVLNTKNRHRGSSCQTSLNIAKKLFDITSQIKNPVPLLSFWEKKSARLVKKQLLSSTYWFSWGKALRLP